MKFNYREDRGYYSPNYPLHSEATTITDGDTKKKIKNRERKIAGKPDQGTKGTETKELSDRNRDRKRQSENLHKQHFNAEVLDQRDEDLSDFREDQHRIKEDIEENKKDLYTQGEGDYQDFENAMKEMNLDRLKIDDPKEYRRQILLLENEAELEEEPNSISLKDEKEVSQWKKEKNFLHNSSRRTNTAQNRAKFFRK